MLTDPDALCLKSAAVSGESGWLNLCPHCPGFQQFGGCLDTIAGILTAAHYGEWEEAEAWADWFLHNLETLEIPAEGVNHMNAKTILLVEPNEHQRMLYREELEEEGYTVLEASDGEQAVSAAQWWRPDAVVLDVGLPGGDGLECLAQLHQVDAHLPIIIHTADPTFRNNFLSWLADAYLLKSSDLTELKQTIHHLLSGQKAAWHEP